MKQLLKKLTFADLLIFAILIWSYIAGERAIPTVYLLALVAGHAFGHGFFSGMPAIKISVSAEERDGE